MLLLLLLLLLEQVVLLGDLHLGVLLLLLLEDELLAVDGYGFADDHAAGGAKAASSLGEAATEVFLLAELLLFLERAELGGRHSLAVAQLDDAGGVIVRLLLGGLLLLLRGLLELLGLLGDLGLLEHLGRLQLGLHRLLGGGWLLLVGLLVHLLLLLLLLGTRRLSGIWGSFCDDGGLYAVLEIFEVV